jgi:Fe-S-cluster containining protein
MGAAAMTQLGDVPCGSCHHCCRSEVIALMPEHGDDVSRYDCQTIEVPGLGSVAVLKHRPNGDCVYLGDKGCTIHGEAPVICQTFDCRHWYRSHSRAERRKMISDSPLTGLVFAAGRERLHSLDPGI